MHKWNEFRTNRPRNGFSSHRRQGLSAGALFVFFGERFGSLFEILIACVISVRTLEEYTLAVSRRIFAVARTPEELITLSDTQLLALLDGPTFSEPKVRQLKDIAEVAERDFGGTLPADYETLLTLHGTGPKCASLALSIATGETPHTPVDTHVHRVTNRWGVVATKTPEKSMGALDALFRPPGRLEINRLLVPFGKYVCKGEHCLRVARRARCAARARATELPGVGKIRGVAEPISDCLIPKKSAIREQILVRLSDTIDHRLLSHRSHVYKFRRESSCFRI